MLACKGERGAAVSVLSIAWWLPRFCHVVSAASCALNCAFDHVLLTHDPVCVFSHVLSMHVKSLLMQLCSGLCEESHRILVFERVWIPAFALLLAPMASNPIRVFKGDGLSSGVRR
eukprot:jgi/Ulvmu1/2864/UM146_0006.1